MKIVANRQCYGQKISGHSLRAVKSMIERGYNDSIGFHTLKVYLKDDFVIICSIVVPNATVILEADLVAGIIDDLDIPAIDSESVKPAGGKEIK